MKRIVSLILVFAFLLSMSLNSFALSTGDTKYSHMNEEKKIKENKAFKANMKELVKEVEFIREEKNVELDGKTFDVKYYKVRFEDTNEGKKLENKINKGITNENQNDSNIIPMDISVEEGTFRVLTYYGTLGFNHNYDGVHDKYESYLKYEAVYDLTELGIVVASCFDTYSGGVLGYYAGQVLSLIESGHKGSGDYSSYERSVTKYGQIYTNDAWRDYYIGWQDEIYWKHDIRAYDSSTGQLLKEDTLRYYPDAYGYLPVIWSHSEDFRYATDISNICFNIYNNGQYNVYNDWNQIEYSRTNWKTQGTFSYY